ncbi:MAG: hypothetical protein CM15mP6_2310 [Methanobacteriota archaeon]|nr:MAG: hypothetical protein CM15mP6_2310 [Euryarchaeota archaeon]
MGGQLRRQAKGFTPLDRDAKSVPPRNLIYATSPPVSPVYPGGPGSGEHFLSGFPPNKGGGTNQGQNRGLPETPTEGGFTKGIHRDDSRNDGEMTNHFHPSLNQF